VRKAAADAVTEGLRPGLRTRAFIYNTLLLDKAVDDRLRRFDHWLASRNMSNEATDDSVEALVSSVRNRYDLPQRWYRLKAKLLGIDKLADYDRSASVVGEDELVEWDDARTIVLDSYASFSPELASIAAEFFERRWIDAPARPGKQPGAFCMYTVPSVHPYLLLNYTARRTDVLTLAHELGHGLHAYLSRPQGVFQQGTPLTLAETASVFGETVTFGRLLAAAETAESRLGLLAQSIEGAIATVFRQTAMNRFEHLAHTARRTEGELSVERLGELWAESQHELFGDAVEVTDNYRSWWSYIPHFISTPGYVYAYSYGQLLALSVYRQYEEQGSDFVPRYLHLLSSGGSIGPEELGKIVGCDLAHPGFWDGGLAIVEQQLEAAETAAFEAGRL
ncbi:MAG TPA: M3 family oligoendopeptidase, partial [Acidimicrobiales bacterium]